MEKMIHQDVIVAEDEKKEKKKEWEGEALFF